jgi:hypothetical protein
MSDSINVAEYIRRVYSHDRIGVPITLHTLCLGTTWRAAECHYANAATGAANNLWNTTRVLNNGETNYRSTPPYVKNYISPEQGVWATVLTLTNGYYDDVLALLRNDAPAPTVMAAIGRSEWGTFKGMSVADCSDFANDVYLRLGLELFATVRPFSTT